MFDVDARWYSNREGAPRTTSEPLAVPQRRAARRMQASVSPAATCPRAIPAGSCAAAHGKILRGSPTRAAAVRRLARAQDRGQAVRAPGYQSNPAHHGVDNGAIIVAHGYVYSARRGRGQRHRETCAGKDANELHYPMQTFPGRDVHGLAGAAVAGRGGARRPRGRHAGGRRRLGARSPAVAPTVVDGGPGAPRLDRDAATLYLQLLALVDCATRRRAS